MTRTAEQSATDVLASVYDHPAALPIDPVVIARSLGVNVWQSALPNAVSGIITRTAEGGDVEAFINSEHAPVRQRFTTAHEIGHLIRHDTIHEPGAPFYYKRDALSACGVYEDEIYANQFAAALLMPEDQVRIYARSHDEFGLARLFGVSLDAMRHRLTNLRVNAAG